MELNLLLFNKVGLFRIDLPVDSRPACNIMPKICMQFLLAVMSAFPFSGRTIAKKWGRPYNDKKMMKNIRG
jgi:hypothetical protein